MRRAAAVFAVLLAMLLAAPAHAQTPEAGTLPGLRYVASRQYAPDPGSPVDTQSDDVYVLSARVYAFDSEEHANAGWNATRESTAIESGMPEDSDKVLFEEKEVDDLGDRAWVTILSAETPDGATGYFQLYYVQEGAMLYTVNVIAGSDEATEIAGEIAREIVDREPGEDEVTFREDGTSTGGVWELLPATGDDVLQGIIAFSDSEIVAAE